MPKGKILFVGKSFTPLIKKIEDCGFEPIVLNRLLRGARNPKRFFRSKKQFFSLLSSLRLKNICGVVNAFEHSIHIQHWALEFYKLHHADEKAVLNSIHKDLMRKALSCNAPSTTPRFQVVRSAKDLSSFLKNSSFPVMLKPASLTKSLLVSKNNNFKELTQSYSHTTSLIKSLYEREGVLQKPKIIIEEFLEGSFHSIQVFSDHKGNISFLPIVDLAMASERNIKDNHVFSRALPSTLSPIQIKKVRRMAKDAVQALGLTSSPAHIEFVYTGSGPKIIEVGARIGGYRNFMYKEAYGYDVLRAQALLSTGKKAIFKNKPLKKNVAVLEFFPTKKGKFVGVEFKNEIPKSVVIKIKKKPGEITGKAIQGYKASAIAFISERSTSRLSKTTATLQNTLVRIR